MSAIQGTNVAAAIVPFTTDDNYPTHREEYGLGGWRGVDQFTDLALIPVERRSDGMAVLVRESKTVYLYEENTETFRVFTNFNNFLSTLVFPLWTELSGYAAANPDLELEDSFAARVVGDAGTHTDPVVGGTVPNSGVYRYHSASPVGWQRVANLEAADASVILGEIETARDVAVAVAADAASRIQTGQGPDDVAVAYVDDYGFAFIAFKDDGTILANSLDIPNLAFGDIEIDSVTSSSFIDGNVSDVMAPDNLVAAWVDDYGFAFAAIYEDGFSDSGGSGGGGNSGEGDPEGYARAASFDTGTSIQIAPGLYLVIFNGQSKSNGYASYPPISTEPSVIDLKMTGDIHTAATSDYSTRTLEPMREIQVIDPVNSVPDGETPVSGMLQMIRGMIELFHGIPVAEQGFSMVPICVGVSGSDADFILNPIYQPYQNSVLAIQRIAVLANAAGRPFRGAFAGSEHGQSDTLQETNPTTFKNAWSNWRTAIEAVCEGISGPKPDLLLALSQTSDHPAYDKSNPAIALAQAELGHLPNIVCSAPTYIMPTGGHDGSDGVHYSPFGSKMNGAYDGIAVFWRYFKGVNWRPLEPTGNKIVIGRTLYVEMNVPVRPLRLSTDWVSNPGNYGCDLRRADNGAQIGIESVGVDGDWLVIKASQDLPSSTDASQTKLRYAWGSTLGVASGPTSGARGCVCDSQGMYLPSEKLVGPEFAGFSFDNYMLISNV